MAFGAVFLLLAFGAAEQTDRNTAQQSKYTAYLGCAVIETNKVDKNLFDNLIALPLCAKDSAQNYCKVQSFEITYAERGLYQDSTGLPIVVTDYTQFACKGDTIPQNWVDVFRERSYKGDTVFIDKIIAKSPDQKMRLCKGLKLIIQ